MSISRYLRRRLDGAGADEGFSLMEAIVAALILAIAATITAALLVNVAGQTRNNGQRSAATNLAASKMERVRQLAATDIPDGRLTETQTVGNTTYTIHQDSTYLSSADGVNACGGSGGTDSLAYKRVSVTVEWPGMGSTKPVQTETLRALGFDASSGGLDAAKGAMAVLVVDDEGKPVDGAAVTLRAFSPNGTALPAQTTGRDGCVVFTGLDSGRNYYSSGSKSSWVALDSSAVQADNGNGISANLVAKRTLTLGRASTLRVGFTAPPGARMPELPISVQHAQWGSPRQFLTRGSCLPAPAQACLSGDGSTITPLYPGNYEVTVLGAGGGEYTEVAAGGTGSFTMKLGAVNFPAGFSGSVLAINQEGDVLPLGTVTGGQPVALPEGSWTLDSALGSLPVTVVAENTTEVAL